MSGASPPPDNSAQVEAMREQAQQQAQQAADAKAAQHVTDLGNLRASARSGATGTVDDYFTQHGVDPTQYAGSIESQLNNILQASRRAMRTPDQALQARANLYGTHLQPLDRPKQ